MDDVWFNSRIETDVRYHNLDHAAGEIPEEIQSFGVCPGGRLVDFRAEGLDEATSIEWDQERKA